MSSPSDTFPGGDGPDPYDVIRTVENAYSETGGLTVLSGKSAEHSSTNR